MTKKTDSFDSYMVHRGITPLDMNTPEPTMAELCAEGEKLLAAEATPKPQPQSPVKSLENALGETSSNPYIRARFQIFKDMTPAQRKEIEELESSGKTDSSIYQAFIKQQVAIGDKLSS